LAAYLRDRHMYTEQVQDFTPTPMSVSTAMYYTGLDPFSLKAVHVPRGREKRIQRAILQYRNPKNYSLVLEGLKMAGRMDLVGEGKKCLIPSRFSALAAGPKGKNGRGKNGRKATERKIGKGRLKKEDRRGRRENEG
jgi:hypothetical protein